MKNFNLVILSCLTLFLTACATTPPERIVVKKETRVVSVPNELLTPCHVSVPPAVETYVAANCEGREELLVVYTNQLLTDLKNCNGRFATIKDWKVKQEDLYKEVQPKEK